MFKCEFYAKYIFARTASMDYPITQSTASPNSVDCAARALATAAVAEAEAIWKELNLKFTDSEIHKTDIRGYKPRETN